MNFDRWIDYVFNQPVFNGIGSGPSHVDYWEGPSPVIVGYLTRTFRECGTLLRPYSDEQVGQGLNFLINPALSDYAFSLKDLAVPVEERVRCIQAIETVYHDCFDPRCRASISPQAKAGSDRLNSVCFMWWDVFPVMGEAHHRPEDPGSAALDQAELQVVSSALLLSSEACVESALHGLGHMFDYYPEATRIVDEFLAGNPDLPDGLRSYALAARLGRVL